MHSFFPRFQPKKERNTVPWSRPRLVEVIIRHQLFGSFEPAVGIQVLPAKNAGDVQWHLRMTFLSRLVSCFWRLRGVLGYCGLSDVVIGFSSCSHAWRLQVYFIVNFGGNNFTVCISGPYSIVFVLTDQHSKLEVILLLSRRSNCLIAMLLSSKNTHTSKTLESERVCVWISDCRILTT